MGKRAEQSQNVQRAKSLLQSELPNVREAFDLAMTLKSKEHRFGFARRLLQYIQAAATTEDSAFRNRLRQQLALCTYKDPGIPESERFDRAIQILSSGEDLRRTTDQETLGIAGATYKYKWRAFAQRNDLELSLSYYRRGYLQGIRSDRGYTAINTAFILDLLAEEEGTQLGNGSDAYIQRIEEARDIRREIVGIGNALLTERPELGNDWWFLVTLAEANFGLGNYGDAMPSLRAAGALTDIAEWEYESTARQLASLARLRMRREGKEAQLIGSEPWQVLESFLGDRAPGVWTAFLGKIGLALSGGGFRASLFHIGVLAKLAELDVLRHVEVLSCVSGGSIVGAHYYLKVRQLLESADDKSDAIDRDSYLKLVSDLEREFLSGVQKNIRTRVIGSCTANLKMAFLSDYSRTERVGELYEKYLFSQVDGTKKNIWLNDLFINPKGEPETFRPKYHNWRRRAKVPILLLNATTLNTGHNWQFTASWMGEPWTSGNSGVDTNYTLQRVHYSEAPPGYQQVRLGYAAAASACVPAIFEPITFPDLFPGIKVRLIDGGVYDNQGTSALLGQGCNVVIVSDASGQMPEENDPASDFIRVPLRSSSILQSRLRLAEYEQLEARRRASLLKGLMFVHLKKDLVAQAIECEKRPYSSMGRDTNAPEGNSATSYGIDKEIQRELAAIRTDLDSFNDAEACALMTSGYLMTEHEFPRALPAFPIPDQIDPPWRFLKVKPLMVGGCADERRQTELKTLLAVARQGAFKIWQLSGFWKPFRTVVIAVLAILGLYVCYMWRDSAVVTYRTIGFFLASLMAGFILARIFGPSVARLLSSFRTPKKIDVQVWRLALYIVVAIAGFVLAWLHISIFDRWYLRRGSLEQVTGEPAAPSKKAQ